MGRVRRSTDDIEFIVLCYNGGVPMSEITREHRVSSRMVRRWVEAAGGEIRGRGVSMGTMRVGVDRARLEELVDSGAEVREIARQLGVSRGTVLRRMWDWRLGGLGDDVGVEVVPDDDTVGNDAGRVVQELVDGMGEGGAGVG